jgi:hypothetical protein
MIEISEESHVISRKYKNNIQIISISRRAQRKIVAPVCIALTKLKISQSRPSHAISPTLHPPTTPSQQKPQHPANHPPSPLPALTKNLQNTGDSLHNPPPILFLLLLRAHPHHLAIVAHGGARLVHVALESAIEPAAHHARRISCHFGVAGTALAVVFAAALVGVEIAEQALGGGGGLRGEC